MGKVPYSKPLDQHAPLRGDDRQPEEHATDGGRRGQENAVLEAELAHIPGRENVRWVALDFSDSDRTFAREFLPNVQLAACAWSSSSQRRGRVRFFLASSFMGD
jgi:hypothetical protein